MGAKSRHYPTKLDVARIMVSNSRGRVIHEARKCHDIIARQNPAYPPYLKRDIKAFDDEKLAQAWLDLSERASAIYPAVEMYEYVQGGAIG